MRSRGAIAAIVLCGALLPTLATAQDLARPLHLVTPGAGGASELWARRVARRLRDDGLETARTLDPSARDAPSGLEARAALVEVEAALRDARRLARDLDERGALVLLASAQRRASRALSLGGSVAWYAEVELSIGIIAAQVGATALASAAFARAFSVAPARSLGAADAAPSVVALGEDAARVLRARPLGRFDVLSPTEGARVFVDDQLLGLLPRRVEVRAGHHVLRVDAPGCVPYAAPVDVLAGAHAPLTVVLAPTPAFAAVRALTVASEARELERLPPLVARVTGALGRPVVLWMVESGVGPFERATAVACDATSCRAPFRLSAGTRDSPRAALESEATSTGARRAALAWRDEALPIDVVPPPPDPWSDGWAWGVLGGGAALLVGAMIVGAVLVSEPVPERPLVFVIEPPSLTP